MNKVKYHGIGNIEGKKVPNLSKFKLSSDMDDLDNKLFGNKHLGYFSSQRVSTCITVAIDEAVKEASYYRQVVQAISSLGEDDAIKYDINSGGGQLEGLIALLAAMSQTEAISIAHINGDASSAASMLALNCDSVYVSPYATMMCHFASYGSAGKAADVKAHVEHTHSICEDLFRSTYELFLTEEEIEKCINGGEIWMNAEEINRRLKHKYSILNAEYEAEAALAVTAEEEEEWEASKVSDFPVLAAVEEVPKARKVGKPKQPK